MTTTTDSSTVNLQAHQADPATVSNLITKYTAIASGAGLLPIPLLDLAALGGVQLKMLYDLGKLYNYTFDQYRAKSIIGVLVATIPAGALVRTTASIFKIIPFIGPILGGVSGFIYSAASTYALGQVFNIHFASGLSLLSFDVDKMKAVYKKYYDEYVSNHGTTTTKTTATATAK